MKTVYCILRGRLFVAELVKETASNAWIARPGYRAERTMKNRDLKLFDSFKEAKAEAVRMAQNHISTRAQELENKRADFAELQSATVEQIANSKGHWVF